MVAVGVVVLVVVVVVDVVVVVGTGIVRVDDAVCEAVRLGDDRDADALSDDVTDMLAEADSVRVPLSVSVRVPFADTDTDGVRRGRGDTVFVPVPTKMAAR